MEYLLVAVEGPLKGSSVALGDGPCTIGREASSSIQLTDPAVSRHHCIIRREGPQDFFLADNDSRNGTFRNGLPVAECQLFDGDEIRVGSSRFLFLSSESQYPNAGLQIEDQDIDPQTIVAIKSEEVVYLNIGQEQFEAAPQSPLMRAMTLLLRLSSSIQVTAGLEALSESVLLALIECVPAEHGTLLLFEHDLEEPAWRFSYPGGTSGEHAVVPRVLINRTVRDRVAALYNGAAANPGLQNMLVAPLCDDNIVLGALCLSIADPRFVFDKSQLQLVTAVGGFLGRYFGQALRFVRLSSENRRLNRDIDLEHGMIGDSPAARELYRFMTKVAPTDSTVLICGESGTGKELIARALHRNSSRADEPYITINCAALTETLIESELFGYEKGAFTGAFAQKRGKFEVADKGTLFLDEIGELPLGLQAKLLRVLQQREFERVGGVKPVRIDVRLIAATNRDLRDAVAKGSFRSDLYYRLNVINIKSPLLRDRAGDILLLAEHFLNRARAKVKRPVRGFSPEACAILSTYPWPGNIRELENAIERGVVIGSDDVIMPEDLPQEIFDTAVEPQGKTNGFHDAVRQAKRRMILDAIRQADGVYTEAAKSLGLNPTYLHRLIDNLNLKPELARLLG